MKNTLYTLTILMLSVVSLYSQNCEMSEEASKHKIRGEVFQENATTPEDYKLVVQEWEKVVSLALNCPDMFYNLAIVYGEMAEFRQAKKHLSRYVDLAKSEIAEQEAKILLIRLNAKQEIFQKQEKH